MVNTAKYSHVSQNRLLYNTVNDACETAFQQYLEWLGKDEVGPAFVYEDINWADLKCVEADVISMKVLVEEAAPDAVSLQDFIRDYAAKNLGNKFISLDVVTEW